MSVHVESSNQKNIVLFDGHCNLCNKSVQFILKRERQPTLFFVSLQSDFGKKILLENGFPESYSDSVLFFEKGVLYRESLAALHISKYLKRPWSCLRALKILPSFVRDGLYRFVAKRRLQWFGTTDSCWVMRPEWRGRFLD